MMRAPGRQPFCSTNVKQLELLLTRQPIELFAASQLDPGVRRSAYLHRRARCLIRRLRAFAHRAATTCVAARDHS